MAFLGVLLGLLLLLWAVSIPVPVLSPSGTWSCRNTCQIMSSPLTEQMAVVPTVHCMAMGLRCCALDPGFTKGPSDPLFSLCLVGPTSSLRHWSLPVPSAWSPAPTPALSHLSNLREDPSVFSLGNGSLRPGLDQLLREPPECLSSSNPQPVYGALYAVPLPANTGPPSWPQLPRLRRWCVCSPVNG